jgi:nucleoside-diphosphate-sugar epimerase
VESGIVMNCACHGQVTLNSLIRELNELLNKDIKPIYAEPRHGDIKHSFADINLVEKKPGFNPLVEFKEGLKQTIHYFEIIQ